MTDFWIKNCAPMSSAHRLNFTSFLAKLASTGANNQICQIALVLFRSTFEETRMFCSLKDSDKEDPSRQMCDLAIADLLPAACASIQEANYGLVQLSEVFWDDCPSEVAQGGREYVDSELGMRSPTWFTPYRWMYWLKRLHEIQDQAADQEHLRQLAGDAIEFMINNAKERNSGILRAYERGGSDLHQDPHLKGLAMDTTEEQQG